MECNICGNDQFADMKDRVGVKCTKCGSLERTRLLWMFIEQLNVQPNWKVLHLAPEVGIYNRLSSLVKPENYVGADLEPERIRFVANCRKIDLTDLESWASNEFDLIIHSHVLEHIPCNVAYPIFHLHRMLKPTGKHLCCIPFSTGVYDECFDQIDDAERARRFGQRDHVRRFGRDGLAMSLGNIVRLPDHFDATDSFNEAALSKHNIPKRLWKGFHTATVLSLSKNDYRLL